MRVTQGNIWNLLPSPQCRCVRGVAIYKRRQSDLSYCSSPQFSTHPVSSELRSVLSSGRISGWCTSCLCAVYQPYLGRTRGPWDPPPPQHAWSFTGSNKPTLYSKEKFGSNKPAFRQLHFKPFWVKTTWALRFTGGSQAHNISTTQ